MELELLALIISIVGLTFAAVLRLSIIKQDAGTPEMKEISQSIRKGAMAFLRREFITLAIFTLVTFFILALLIEPKPGVALAYLFGTVTSAIAGFLGMDIATRANTRTANSAVGSWANALKIAFSSGAVMGFCVVGLGLFGLTVIAMLSKDSHVWLGFAFGASSVALFLRVGGGIFTKSADVGSDLVGKVEKDLPEDDPRNAAVIADLVGDNVGDIAGMGSDLYESYVSALAAAMVLGVIAFQMKGMMLPLFLGSIGIIASIIGALSVRPQEFKGSFEQQVKKAHDTMNRGVYVSNILMIIAGYLAIRLYIGGDGLGIFWALIAGLICGFLIGEVTEYFTSEHKPVLGIAKASETGPAINIMEGLSVGMLSTVIPIILVAVTTVAAFYFAGLLGIAIAAVGMLINLGMLLAMDCYGPIVDNAAGIAEMAGLGKEVRERCEALDAVGNTTAALGKGFAIGSAALASLAWLATYFEVAKIEVASITNVDVIAGLLIGGMMAFLFCALAIKGVSNGAFEVVNEVRRQFREIKGLLEGTTKPDYVSCVDIATKRALKSMLLPGIIVIIVPIVIGFSLGTEALAGVLTGALLTGFLLAIMMANAGGAWDNAKKYIEAGHLGGKGSEAHKSAVIGDTVGDPFKDAAGPSLNILIKLIGKIAVIFAPLFLLFA
ncbi:MAG: sodium-translocating pyrophosphatase [Dehalococcoidia bacterium]|nr:MAG: sodium-translocating pyrophosphatase [Dehalococcoidia bacterium]